MATYTPELLEELAARERHAWSAYRESLRDLRGAQYDLAEEACWGDLQRALADVAAERAELDDESPGA